MSYRRGFMAPLLPPAKLSAAGAAERVFRVAFLARTEDSLQIAQRALRELARLGFREGENLICLGAAGDSSQLEDFASKMTARRPDAIVPIGGEAIHAAQ
jgi:hypothetical protein